MKKENKNILIGFSWCPWCLGGEKAVSLAF
jgi:hypothetical protein